MTEQEKMYQAIYKAIGEGAAKFIRYSLAYFTLICVVFGLSYAIYAINIHHGQEIKALKAELKEQADALKTANRLMIEAQIERQICRNELGRVSAEMAELREEVRLLKKSKR